MTDSIDSFEQLMVDSADYVAELRANLESMRPQLMAVRDSYIAFIDSLEKHPGLLFGYAPPLPNGGFARLVPADETEAAKAVVRILQRRLVKILRVLGDCA